MADTLDAHYQAARAEAYRTVPQGCTCTHTAKLLNPRGHCAWCTVYWAARLMLDAAAATAKSEALRERLQKLQHPDAPRKRE